MNRPLPPDPEQMNGTRSSWAGAAIEAFILRTRTDREDAMADLLCDLMHYCDRRDLLFHQELTRAYGYYFEETDGSKSTFPDH